VRSYRITTLHPKRRDAALFFSVSFSCLFDLRSGDLAAKTLDEPLMARSGRRELEALSRLPQSFFLPCRSGAHRRSTLIFLRSEGDSKACVKSFSGAILPVSSFPETVSS